MAMNKCQNHPRYGRSNLEEVHNNHPKVGDCKTCLSIATAQRILRENPLDQKYFEISETQATKRLPTPALWRRRWQQESLKANLQKARWRLVR